MKRAAFVLSVIMLFGFDMSFGQFNKTNQNTIGVSIGWQQLKFNDQLASPLTYKGMVHPTFGLNYTRQSDHTFLKIKAAGGIGTANPQRFGDRDYMTLINGQDSFQYKISSAFINANIEGTFMKRINPTHPGNFAYWVGGTVNEQAYYADEVANFPWVINTIDLAPSFKLDYAINPKQSITLKIDFASIGVITRSVYSLFAKSSKDKNVPAFFKQGTRIASVNKYQRVNLELDYKYYASNRVIIGGTYSAKWFHYTYPMDLKGMDNRFNINLDYSVHK